MESHDEVTQASEIIKCPSFQEFIDGETELRQEREPFSGVSLTRSLIRTTLKTFRQYQTLIRDRQEESTEASMVLYNLCEQGQVSIGKMITLVNFGANVNYKPPGVTTQALHHLSKHLNHDAIALAVQVGADCASRESEFGRTPLLIACSRHKADLGFTSIRQLKTVQALLRANANVINISDNDDRATRTNNPQQLLCGLQCAGCMDTDAGAQARCDESVSRAGAYKLRTELRTSISTLAIQRKEEDRRYDAERDRASAPSIVGIGTEDVAAVGASEEEKARLAEQRHQRRQASKALKQQVRGAKQRTALEAEREQKKMEYMKRVENEYKVSFQGLFPR